MPEPEQCQRCHQTIDGNRAVLLVDTGDPKAKMQGLTVCGRCLESYQRWTARRGRSRTAHAPSKVANPPKNESGRKHKRQQPLTATEARERHASRMRIRIVGITALIALAGYVLLSLLAYVLFSGK